MNSSVPMRRKVNFGEDYGAVEASFQEAEAVVVRDEYFD